ncbi:hypothetical protein [Planctomycetes bacterium K23_9]
MKRFLSTCLVLGGISVFAVGCGTSEPSNVMDNVDEKELLDYEAMIAAENQAMDSDTGDVE